MRTAKPTTTTQVPRSCSSSSKDIIVALCQSFTRLAALRKSTSCEHLFDTYLGDRRTIRASQFLPAQCAFPQQLQLESFNLFKEQGSFVHTRSGLNWKEPN